VGIASRRVILAQLKRDKADEELPLYLTAATHEPDASIRAWARLQLRAYAPHLQERWQAEYSKLLAQGIPPESLAPVTAGSSPVDPHAPGRAAPELKAKPSEGPSDEDPEVQFDDP